MLHSNITEGLIDGDMLKYEIGFAAESYWRKFHEDLGLEVDPETVPWHVVEDMVDNRVGNILGILGIEKDKAYIFFTGSYNFRYDITDLFDYKTRDSRKPYHHKNIEVYLQSEYNCIREDTMEADDSMAMWLTESPDTRILISRDKDMWQVPGWHYSWELGRQPERGPEYVNDDVGWLNLVNSKKLEGAGFKWFCAQLLMGDKTDSIPGLPRFGPVGAYKALNKYNTKRDCMYAVRALYESNYGSRWDEWLNQVGRTLWLQRYKGQIWHFDDKENYA